VASAGAEVLQSDIGDSIEDILSTEAHGVAVTELPAGVVRIGSTVLVEKIADGCKMTFTLSKDRKDPDNGFVALHTPLGDALLEAEEGETVSSVAGPYVHEVRVLSVADWAGADEIRPRNRNGKFPGGGVIPNPR
jgi:transcription elongation GreA/GreB family factor